MLRWTTDRRTMSPFTRIYVAGMWLRRDKRAFRDARTTLKVARRRQADGDRAPTLLTRLRSRATVGVRGGLAVWRVGPRRRTAVVRVVYVHGGGYVHPLTADYWRLVRSLVSIPAEVLVPTYPLAPGASVDDVMPMLEQLALESMRAEDALPLVLMGDSAGGAMVIALAGLLRDRAEELPILVVAISPWLDATLHHDEVRDLEATDPMLAEDGLRAAGRWWSGRRRPDDPWVSPVLLDLDGLPPVEVLIGDRDILRPAVDELAERSRTRHVDLHVHEVVAMFHVWVTRAIPEGRRARRQLAATVRAAVGRDARRSG